MEQDITIPDKKSFISVQKLIKLPLRNFLSPEAFISMSNCDKNLYCMKIEYGFAVKIPQNMKYFSVLIEEVILTLQTVYMAILAQLGSLQRREKKLNGLFDRNIFHQAFHKQKILSCKDDKLN
ncbi:CLUMA_CG012724, isoform A [Clunio marinus]|uniref:CLUMA_CG012724, isoform A n=1 Tax=Clunio marinus TaxID=568069 RepID=A0A1J1IHK8_9DIPT|nr:CLUMA_CG012724, isoform A [Clunio marinus]